MPKPKIDKKKCNLCRTCVEICPMSIFEAKDTEIKIVKPEECIGCRACEAQCSQGAITVEE